MVLARMRRYSASLLVQESGLHQLVAEFNMGRGIARASLAQEVATTVADAMTSFSQVCKAWLRRSCRELGSGLLMLTAKEFPVLRRVLLC